MILSSERASSRAGPDFNVRPATYVGWICIAVSNQSWRQCPGLREAFVTASLLRRNIPSHGAQIDTRLGAFAYLQANQQNNSDAGLAMQFQSTIEPTGS